MGKKWPTVETSVQGLISSEEALRQDAGNAEDDTIPWEQVSKVSINLLRTGNRAGVLLVCIKNVGVVVVKATASGPQEMFSKLVAAELGVAAPKMRIVQKGTDEYEKMLTGICSVCPENTYERSLLRDTYLSRPFLLVIQVVQGCVAMDSEKAQELINVSTLRRIGTMICMDVFMHNHDRIPVKGVFDNDGNTGNIFLSLSKDGGVIAIDNSVNSPLDETFRATYLEKVDCLVSSKEALRSGLAESLRFIQAKIRATSLCEGALDALCDGFIAGMERVRKHLTKERIRHLFDQIRQSVDVQDDASATSLKCINPEFLCRIGEIIRHSPILHPDEQQFENTSFHRIDGADGLAKRLHEIAQRVDEKDYILVFDFDRTLTNGFCSPHEKAIEKRIRGGQRTIDALRKLKELNTPMFIVTARSPRAMVVQQLVSSLSGPQDELGEIFLPVAAQDVNASEIRYVGVELALALNAPLYASDYQKPAAVANILDRYFEKTDASCASAIHVAFFDDVFTNAHDVGSRTHRLLHEAGRDDLASAVHVCGTWWDTFEEEFGANQSMKPTFRKNTEQAYPDFALSLLGEFGLDAKEVDRRIGIIKAAEKASGWKDPVQAPKEPGKLNKATAAQENLAKFLFGGGKGKR